MSDAGVAGELAAARILLVDDEPANLFLLERVLARAGFAQVRSATGGEEALELQSRWLPHLVLLDLHMPPPDGFEVMRRLRGQAEQRPAVVVLTADVTTDAKRRALAGGADDFLTKPLDIVEVELRVRNLVRTRLLQIGLEEHNRRLEERVRERTAELERARLELLQRLAHAAEYRDDATQEHAERVGRAAAAIGHGLGLELTVVDLLRQAAPLHDIGKIGVPDRVLLKPGGLDQGELFAMRAHTTIGAQLLAASHSPVLRLAERIALTHHERWDGRGYPTGTAGQTTDLCGRIVAVADVFDALAHPRPYKEAWPLERVLAELRAQRELQFDPDVVEVFLSLDPEALLAPVATDRASTGAAAELAASAARARARTLTRATT